MDGDVAEMGVQDLLTLGPGRVRVRIVGGPHQVVDAQDMPLGHAEGVLLEGGGHVLLPIEAGELLQHVVVVPTMAVLHGIETTEIERDPAEPRLDQYDLEPREALEDAAHDPVGDDLGHEDRRQRLEDAPGLW